MLLLRRVQASTSGPFTPWDNGGRLFHPLLLPAMPSFDIIANANKVRQVIPVRTGVAQELASKIQPMLKTTKMKVQGPIHGEAIRMSGANRDDPRDAIALVKKSSADFLQQRENFGD